MIGWFHPYCRVIGGDLNRCLFTGVAFENEDDARIRRVSQSMLKYFRMVGFAAPGIRQILPANLKSSLKFDLKLDHNSERTKVNHVKSLKRIAHEGASAAADGALSLVMIHFPIPHYPYIYDRRKDDFTFEGGHDYFDNLKLVDRTLGDLRHSMEQAAMWDNTVVLVSSDHWWRFYQWQEYQPLMAEEQAVTSGARDDRIPFILKLKGQKGNVIYNPSFNTVLSQDLILALLRGALSTPSDVTTWLDQHRSIGKSPY
jgi:hypothetical protein